jgi:chromosome segregation ATPase
MALVPDERQELEQQLKALDDQIQNLEGTEQASVSLKRKRFETEQRLSDAQAKWTRYHAEFENRQLRSRQARAMPNAAAAPAIPNKLSAPVADLLEQMKAKGLFRNFGQ